MDWPLPPPTHTMVEGGQLHLLTSSNYSNKSNYTFEKNVI